MPRWTVSTENRGAIPEHFRPFVVIDEAGNVIARLPNGRAPADRAKAELIAAAPELLAITERLLNAYIGAKRIRNPANNAICLDASAAIAKAKGA